MPGVRRLKSIEILVIPSERYPQFREDREHLFMNMKEDVRTKEAVEMFAHVHAQKALSHRALKGPPKIAKAS